MNKNIIEINQELLKGQLNSLSKLKLILNNDYLEILDALLNVKGKILFTGVGKSALISKKISSSMNSLGIPSFFIHSTEAAHGDLGLFQEEDIVIIISHSGESDEILNIIPSIKRIGSNIILISSNEKSRLNQICDKSIIYPFDKEAGVIDFAPTTSSLIQLMIGNLITLSLANLKNINRDTFALFHPKGFLGKSLTLRVKDVMKKGNRNSTVFHNSSLKDAIIEMSKKSLGIVNVVDKDNNLKGIFTDGDLRRFFALTDSVKEVFISQLITTKPIIFFENEYAIDALKKLEINEINTAPVTNNNNKLVGTLRLIDLIDEGLKK